MKSGCLRFISPTIHCTVYIGQASVIIYRLIKEKTKGVHPFVVMSITHMDLSYLKWGHAILLDIFKSFIFVGAKLGQLY